MSGNGDSDQQRSLRVVIKKIKLHGGFKGRDVDVFVRFDGHRESVTEVVVKGARLAVGELKEIEHHILRRSHRNKRAHLNVTPKIEVPPSSYLYNLGRLLDKSTREMVFKPLIDDFHHEYFEALADGRSTRRLIWVYRCHGTIALLRALWLGFRKQLVSGGG